MTGLPEAAFVCAIGMRHGLDPDHLSAIDGLSRLHPSRWNGVLFALGHGALVTLLAVGLGSTLATVLEPYSAWVLLLLGLLNLWRVYRPAAPHSHVQSRYVPRVLWSSPLALGILFGMGFETASQLSALMLAQRTGPWLLGVVFTLGMMLVDGSDGLLASRTQSMANGGSTRALQASRWLGLMVGVASILLAVQEMVGGNASRYATPLGALLFAAVLVLRLWSRRSPVLAMPSISSSCR